MVTLRVKSKSGQVTEIPVEALLAIDGVPYQASSSELRDAVLHLDGRVAAIEGLMSGLLRGPEHTEQQHG